MREQIILICKECLARNYTTTKKKEGATKRLTVNKYCPRCNRHTAHNESK